MDRISGKAVVGADTAPMRVFLSHTSDLRDHPKDRSFIGAAEAAVIRAGHAMIDMAYFAARDAEPAAYCTSMLALADIYIGVIGMRYGAQVRDRPDVSYTELEFEVATARRLPRFVFLIQEKSTFLPPASQSTLHRCRQDAFRRRLQDSDLTVVEVTSPDELELSVYQAIVEWERETPIAPCQLPPAIADFTDRWAVITQIERALVRTGSTDRALPVIAVTGKPGVGKTAVAIQVAHQLTSLYRDGQLYANLRGFEKERVPAEEVLAEFLRALGVDGNAIPEKLDARSRLMRERLTGRHVLLVLDNASGANQVRPLLPGEPKCGVVVTSRARLSTLEGVSVIDLDVLEPDEAADLLTRIIGSERASESPEAVREVVSLCGALPLALRIAGAKMLARPHWTVSQLAQRLRDERRRLIELSTGDMEVRAAFDISYEGLTDDQKRLFRRLSLLRAETFAPWLAGSLIDTEVTNAEEILETLAEAHLIDAIRAHGGTTRYRFHDLIRIFAHECALKEDDVAARQAALTRALGAYLCLAVAGGDRLERRLRGQHRWNVAQQWDPGRHMRESVEADPWAWFTVERASLVHAVEQAAAEVDPAIAWEIADTLPSYFEGQARWDDWERTTSAALTGARRANNSFAEAVTLVASSREHSDQGHWDVAVVRSDRAIQLFRSLDDRLGEAHARRMTAYANWFQGRGQRAINDVEWSIPVFQEFGDRHEEAVGLRTLADIEREMGRLTEAEAHARLALDRFTQLSDRRWEAVVRRTLGEALREQNRLEEAIASFQASIATFEELDDRRERAMALHALAITFRRYGQLDDAARVVEDSVSVFAELDQPHWQAVSLSELGQILAELGRIGDALQRLSAGLALARENSERLLEAQMLEDMGEIHASVGDRDMARREWTASLAIYREVQSPHAKAIERQLQSLGT